MHDGGLAIEMLLNDKVVCRSLPTYGAAPGGGTKQPDGKEWQTILEMSRCEDPVEFKKGDGIKLITYYDIDRHPL